MKGSLKLNKDFGVLGWGQGHLITSFLFLADPELFRNDLPW